MFTCIDTLIRWSKWLWIYERCVSLFSDRVCYSSSGRRNMKIGLIMHTRICFLSFTQKVQIELTFSRKLLEKLFVPHQDNTHISIHLSEHLDVFAHLFTYFSFFCHPLEHNYLNIMLRCKRATKTKLLPTVDLLLIAKATSRYKPLKINLKISHQGN